MNKLVESIGQIHQHCMRKYSCFGRP